jgi:hypothetical protein
MLVQTPNLGMAFRMIQRERFQPISTLRQMPQATSLPAYLI